jgi:hypothetical protein
MITICLFPGKKEYPLQFLLPETCPLLGITLANDKRDPPSLDKLTPDNKTLRGLFL